MNDHSPASKSSSATDNLADTARHAVHGYDTHAIGDAVDRGERPAMSKPAQRQTIWRILPRSKSRRSLPNSQR